MFNWIRSMLERIKALFRRKPKPEVYQPTELEKKLAARIQARQLANTRQILPNMPKAQPCPLCRTWIKRKRKTMGGADYHCNRCKSGFFVRAK